MLVYPDESPPDSLAAACLDAYTGQLVVHIGQLMNVGGAFDDEPYGKTTAPVAQDALRRDFHCVLRMPLPSWPFSDDCLTVWKRSRIVDCEAAQLRFRFVPAAERIPAQPVAAAAFEQFLPGHSE